MKMHIKHLVLMSCLVLPTPFVTAQIQVSAPDTAAAATITGKVTETMNAAGYTYVQVDAGGNKVWAATTQFAVKVGDSISFQATDPMTDFHSKTLNRDFDVVYFAGSITVNTNGTAIVPPPALPPGHPALPGTTAPTLPPGHPALPGVETSALPPGHPPLAGKAVAPDLDLKGIKPAVGGKTIGQIYADLARLAGKPVAVRGKVMKYNAMILGKNWLHIRDGSGSTDKHNHDLTVATTSEAKLGDIVLVTGVLSTNKDFGSNYRFDVMIDDAKVAVEKAP